MRRTVCVFTYHYSFDSPSSFSLLPFSMAPLPTLQRQPRSVQHHGQSFDCNLPSSTATTSREIRQIAPKITITFKTHSHHFLHTTTIATPSLRDLIPSPSFLETHRKYHHLTPPSYFPANITETPNITTLYQP